MDYLGISKNVFTDWKSGKNKSYHKHLPKIADFFGVTVDYLLGKAEIPSPAQKMPAGEVIFLDKQKIRLVPLYENVSAGFGAYANDCIVDYIPTVIMSDSEASETIAIKVQGDSMFPKIEEGDTIIVRKQDSVDSGSVAVVLLDGEEGLVKKITYGQDWIELHSFNPMYPPRRFEGADILRLRVVGLVKQVLKNI